ncbi:MAG: GNAT family N-acetyltransferase [Acetobacteraceae bacterium]
MQVVTQRLVLRPPRLADVPCLFGFLGDREAMRFTHHDPTLRECRRRIAAHEWRRRRDGFAPWVLVDQAESRIIGWGGLYNDPFDPGWGPELGYFLHPAAWGRGYASELAGACIDVADTVLRLPELHAFAMPDNAASRRVLVKAGFREQRFIPAMQRLLFRRPLGG